MLHCDFDEQALLEDVDAENDTVGIGGVVHVAFESMQGSADDFNAAAFGEEGHHADFVSGCDNSLNISELTKEGCFVGDGNSAREEVLLINARFQFERYAGKDVAGKEGFGEFLRLFSVVANTNDERQIMFEAFGGHERCEFLFAAGFRMTNKPSGFGGIDEQAGESRGD